MKKRIIEGLAMSGNMVGAMLVAFSGNRPELAVVGYLLFIVGCTAAIYLIKHSNASRSLLLINWYFMGANIIGIITRLPGLF